jgi:hypothetical protein
MRTSLYLFDAAEELARGRLSQNLFASPSPDSPGDTTPPVHFFVSAPSSMPRRSLSVNATSGPAPSRISWMTPSHAAPPSTSTCGRRASSWPAAPDSLPLHLPISLALDTTPPVSFSLSAAPSMPRRSLSVNASFGPAPSRLH